jgi:hypothetical protein
MMVVVFTGRMAVRAVAPPKPKPELYGPRGEKLLPQSTASFKPGEIVLYKGERVRVSEHIGDYVNIFIPSRQELVWVKSQQLERIESVEPMPQVTHRGLAVMPKLPSEAYKDILFVEYIRDLVKLGETVTDQEAKLMWEAWKKRYEKEYQAQTLPCKTLRFAAEPRTVTAQTFKKWLKQGRAQPLQVSGYYGAEGPKPALYIVDDTIYRIEWRTYSHDLLPAGREDLAEKTRKRLKERGIELVSAETGSPAKVIPTEPRPRRKSDLEYLADSPEFLTQTIDDIGYRDKLDTTFREAIARAKGLKELK